MLFLLSMRFFSYFSFVCLILIINAGCVRAQSPEGPQLPVPDDRVGVLHGEIRLGYYAAPNPYRSQGEYEASTNLTRIAKSPVYVFGDVNVEVLPDGSNGRFKPDRLTGTFELGVRQLFGVAPLSIYLRHQSAHYIDRSDELGGGWEMVGGRWQQMIGTTQITASLAHYAHVYEVTSTYSTDADIQAVTALGMLGKHRTELRSDIHLVTGHGGRGGFSDFWLEPDIFLSAQTVAFLGYGQIHDTNVTDINSDHPLIVGLRLLY